MRRLAVFARPPLPGRVKTRLSPALPPALACGLHRAMIDDTLVTGRRAGADQRVLFWADDPGAGPEPEGFSVRLQQGSDLGARLEHAFRGLLAGDAAAVIVG